MANDTEFGLAGYFYSAISDEFGAARALNAEWSA
jgi:hypothetical protein